MNQEKKRIVIVDDDLDLLRLLVAAFEAQGFEVIGLKTGKEAKAYFEDSTHLAGISLLILDRILPDLDGMELLYLLKEHSKVRFPVLILSALSAEKDVLYGLKKGAVDYITKPFSLSILMQKARTLLPQE